MGIQRFTQDLQPYVESAILGLFPRDREATWTITSLVVDGPSLVYHVYNKLLAYRCLEAGTGAPQQPTYGEIATATIHLLADLNAHGINLEAIYFDGALPAGKQETRLQRLERTRCQLQSYRTLNRDAPPPPASPRVPVNSERALWLQVATPADRSLLPPPPFLVPAAIEALQQSRWAAQIHVVAEEADVSCARTAASTSASILSNDSDMSVYDLGERGSVVMLQTLEKHKLKHSASESVLRAGCIRPKSVAASLRLPSLLELAFERSHDGNASSAIIAERAREPRTETTDELFQSFAAEYSIPPAYSYMPMLQHLDPRSAEFVAHSRSSSSTPPTIYLPILHEDHDRDATWSHSIDIRQLAYSIYLSTLQRQPRHKVVTEHFRKGPRITSQKLPVLISPALNTATTRLLDLHTFTSTHQPHINLPNTILRYHMLALHHLLHNAPPLPTVLTRTNLHSLFLLSATRTTWSTIHLLATLHATLYSLRMLKQLLTAAAAAVSTTPNLPASPDILADDSTRNLSELLADIPPIAELFLDVADLQALVKASGNVFDTALKAVVEMLPEEAKQPPSAGRGGGRGQERSLRRAGQGGQQRRDGGRGGRTAGGADGRGRGRNMFDVLGEM